MKAAQDEARLLGAVLGSSEPSKMLQAAGLVPEDFSDGWVRTAWSVALELGHRGERVDAMTLCAAARTTKRMGEEDLGVLIALESRNTLDHASFVQVAREYRRHAHSRKVGAELKQLGDQLLDGKTSAAAALPVFEALRATYSRLHAEGRRGSDVVVAAFEGAARRQKDNRPTLVPTGLQLLDEQTGGFPPKLCVLLGPPGVMKSGLIGTMLEQQCAQQLRPLVFSLEDNDEWVIKRHMAKRTGMRVRDVFSKEFPDGEKAATAAQELSGLFNDAWFCTKQHARTPEDMVRIATQYIAQQNISIVYVDNARAVKCEPKNRWEQKRDAISRMYETFAEFADTYRIPLVLLAHTTRKYEERTQSKSPPIMSDIGETADAERDVRYLLALWQRHGNFRVTVAKQTEGEPGTTMEFDRLKEAALIDPAGGQVVNLQAEARKEREERTARTDEESVARAAHREELKKKRKADLTPAPPEVKPEEQASLFDAQPEAPKEQ